MNFQSRQAHQLIGYNSLQTRWLFFFNEASSSLYGPHQRFANPAGRSRGSPNLRWHLGLMKMLVFWHKNSTFGTRSLGWVFFLWEFGGIHLPHFRFCNDTEVVSISCFIVTGQQGFNWGGSTHSTGISQGKSGRHRSVAAGTLLHYILLSEGYSTSEWKNLLHCCWWHSSKGCQTLVDLLWSICTGAQE